MKKVKHVYGIDVKYIKQDEHGWETHEVYSGYKFVTDVYDIDKPIQKRDFEEAQEELAQNLKNHISFLTNQLNTQSFVMFSFNKEHSFILKSDNIRSIDTFNKEIEVEND